MEKKRRRDEVHEARANSPLNANFIPLLPVTNDPHVFFFSSVLSLMHSQRPFEKVELL